MTDVEDRLDFLKGGVGMLANMGGEFDGVELAPAAPGGLGGEGVGLGGGEVAINGAFAQREPPGGLVRRRHFLRFRFRHNSLYLSGYASHTKITDRPADSRQSAGGEAFVGGWRLFKPSALPTAKGVSLLEHSGFHVDLSS